MHLCLFLLFLSVLQDRMTEDRVQSKTAMRKDARRRRFAEESARLAVTSLEAPARTFHAAFATMRLLFRREIIRALLILRHKEQPVPSECQGPSSSVQIHGTRMRETLGHSTELPVRRRMARSLSSSGMKDLLQMHWRQQIRFITRRPGCPAKRGS